MKNLVSVNFLGNDKEYYYWTKLNLVEGAVYDVVVDNRTVYKTPVMVVGVKRDENADRRTINGIGLREITNATVIQGAPRPKSLVERVIYNPKKKVTTVFWSDGFPITCVKQHECEKYDGEKALAMAFMKRAYGNRGCFNEDLKKFAQPAPKEEKEKTPPTITFNANEGPVNIETFKMPLYGDIFTPDFIRGLKKANDHWNKIYGSYLRNGGIVDEWNKNS